MNKPLTMIIKETRTKLAEVCNGAIKSGLTPAILDLVVQGIYFEIHSLVEKQSLDEEVAYMKAIEDEKITREKALESKNVESKN